jgi:hypothetical protein
MKYFMHYKVNFQIIMYCNNRIFSKKYKWEYVVKKYKAKY